MKGKSKKRYVPAEPFCKMMETALQFLGMKIPVTLHIERSKSLEWARVTVGDFTVEWNTDTKMWDVSVTVCHRGVHTLRNGDPGYPDEYEDVALESFGENRRARMAKYIALKLAEQSIDAAIENVLTDMDDVKAARAGLIPERSTHDLRTELQQHGDPAGTEAAIRHLVAPRRPSLAARGRRAKRVRARRHARASE
jgi:hypothetical protein